MPAAYEERSLASLKGLAKQRQLKNYSQISKKALINLLRRSNKSSSKSSSRKTACSRMRKSGCSRTRGRCDWKDGRCSSKGRRRSTSKKTGGGGSSSKKDGRFARSTTTGRRVTACSSMRAPSCKRSERCSWKDSQCFDPVKRRQRLKAKAAADNDDIDDNSAADDDDDDDGDATANLKGRALYQHLKEPGNVSKHVDHDQLKKLQMMAAADGGNAAMQNKQQNRQLALGPTPLAASVSNPPMYRNTVGAFSEIQNVTDIDKSGDWWYMASRDAAQQQQQQLSSRFIPNMAIPVTVIDAENAGCNLVAVFPAIDNSNQNSTRYSMRKITKSATYYNDQSWETESDMLSRLRFAGDSGVRVPWMFATWKDATHYYFLLERLDHTLADRTVRKGAKIREQPLNQIWLKRDLNSLEAALLEQLDMPSKPTTVSTAGIIYHTMLTPSTIFWKGDVDKPQWIVGGWWAANMFSASTAFQSSAVDALILQRDGGVGDIPGGLFKRPSMLPARKVQAAAGPTTSYYQHYNSAHNTRMFMENLMWLRQDTMVDDKGAVGTSWLPHNKRLSEQMRDDIKRGAPSATTLKSRDTSAPMESTATATQ